MTAKIDEATRLKMSEALDKLIGAQDSLFDAQQKMFELQEQNASLKRSLEEAERWVAKSDSYKLTSSPGGAVVYEFSGTPPHYACPICFESKRIAILQDRKVSFGTWDCPGCKAEYNVSESESIRHRR